MADRPRASRLFARSAIPARNPRGKDQEDGDDDEAVDDVLGVLQRAEEVGEERDEGGPAEAPPQRPQAADDHHDDEVDGGENAEGVRGDRAHVVGEEAPPDGGEDGRDSEDGDLPAADIHAHGRGGDLVLGQRGEAPARRRSGRG